MQMSSVDAKGRGAPRREPSGGYEGISVTQLAMVWWAYQSGLISKLGLRAYFGCWELETRRRLSGRKIPTVTRRAPEARRRDARGGAGGPATRREPPPRAGAAPHLLEGGDLVRDLARRDQARGQVRPRFHARRDAGHHPQGPRAEADHPPPRRWPQQGPDGGRHRPPHPLPLLSQGRGHQPRRLLQGLVDRPRLRHHRAERLRRARATSPSNSAGSSRRTTPNASSTATGSGSP